MANKLKSDSLVEITEILFSSQFKIFYLKLKTNGQTYAKECENENILNDFFKDDLRNAEIPAIPDDHIVFISKEVDY